MSDKAAYQRAWRQQHPDYHKNYRHAHKEQRNAKSREYFRLHREKRLEQAKVWRHNNVEKARELDTRKRARKRSAAIGKVDYELIMLRDRMRCGICGKRVARKDLSFDHIIPLVCGGAHAEWNIQVAHLTCNSRKNVGYLPSQVRLPM